MEIKGSGSGGEKERKMERRLEVGGKRWREDR